MKRRGAPVLLWAAVALEVAARPASEGRAPLLRRGQLREALPQLGAAAAARQPRMPRPVQMSYWGDFEERNAGDACKPKCRWSCEAPECSEVCNITCAPALCATACPPVDQRSCKTVCPPPNCKTFCSGGATASPWSGGRPRARRRTAARRVRPAAPPLQVGVRRALRFPVRGAGVPVLVPRAEGLPEARVQAEVREVVGPPGRRAAADVPRGHEHGRFSQSPLQSELPGARRADGCRSASPARTSARASAGASPAPGPDAAHQIACRP
ncbi:unnamed protein product [Prorocentrum cordatum]|uniref:Uncharacterized protein n=1 Tax=Prorocentrum cordatum TaxID=2364126 RepID=A0ABN9XCE8_9DINO|nr:unnamed protein product [Polarella glacialis]